MADKEVGELIGGRRPSRFYDSFKNTVIKDKTVANDGVDSVNIVDTVDRELGRVYFRSLEAGDGISLSLEDADENKNIYTDYQKIIISATGTAAPNKITVEDEGNIEGQVSSINFVGSGVNALVSGDTATINIQGGTNTLVYEPPLIVSGQTVFDIPFNAISVETVTINGLESTNFLFSLGPPRIIFNPINEGYDLEPTDELLVFYHI
jgi:hypothetical protein